MLRRIVFNILFILLGWQAMAAIEPSLIKAFNSAKSPSERKQLSLEIANGYLDVNLDSAKYWADKSAELSDSEFWQSDLCQCYNDIIEKYRKRNDLASAGKLAKYILKNKAKYKNDKLSIRCFNTIGTQLSFEGNFNIALIYLTRSLVHLDSLKNDTLYQAQRFEVLSRMGILNGMQNKLANALHWFLKADSLAYITGSLIQKAAASEDIGNVLLLSSSYNDALERYKACEEYAAMGIGIDLNSLYDNLANCYKGLNQYDKAIAYCVKSRKEARSKKDSFLVAYSYFTHGFIHCDKKEYELACAKFEYAENVFVNSQIPSYATSAKSAWLFSTIEFRKDFDYLLIMANEVLDSLRISGDPAEYSRTLKSRSKINANLGFYKEAYRDLVTHDSMSAEKTLENYSVQKAIQEILYKTKNYKRQAAEQKEIAEWNADKNRRKTIIIYIISGFGLIMFLILLLMYRLMIKIRDSRKLIANQNRFLAEKEARNIDLMKELHHRVKNNLQIVSSLLSLQSDKVTDRNAKSAFTEGRNRVDAMAMIHRYLYMNNELTTVDIRKYIEKLTESIAFSYGYSKSNLSIVYELEATHVEVDIAIPMGLIANELVSNTFKHAFIGVEKPELKLTLSMHGDVFFEVSDNGRGLPDNFLELNHNSFGIELILSLTRQLKGQLQYSNVNGSRFQLRIPLDKPPKH